MPRHLGSDLTRFEKFEARKKLNILRKKWDQMDARDSNYVANALIWAANKMLTYRDLLEIRRLYDLYK